MKRNFFKYNDRQIDYIKMQDYIVRLASVAVGTPCIEMSPVQRDAAIEPILNDALDDLAAYHQRDPSVRRKSVSCLVSPRSTSFAVLAYRIAHHLITTSADERGPDAVDHAMRISFYARSQSGTDIHPETVIGRRFVVDHDRGTVIGHTTEIGHDCYLLNDVTLGARTVANAPDGKRHPTIGNSVQICARAKVLGPVVIGDNCFIGPDVTITTDVAPRICVLTSKDSHGQRFAARMRVNERVDK